MRSSNERPGKKRKGLSSRHPPLERSSMRAVPSGWVGSDTVVRNCTGKRGEARRSSIFMSMTDRFPTFPSMEPITRSFPLRQYPLLHLHPVRLEELDDVALDG